ncbi:unnamed protein product [Eretmochelys imbricata]
MQPRCGAQGAALPTGTTQSVSLLAFNLLIKDNVAGRGPGWVRGHQLLGQSVQGNPEQTLDSKAEMPGGNSGDRARSPARDTWQHGGGLPERSKGGGGGVSALPEGRERRSLPCLRGAKGGGSLPCLRGANGGVSALPEGRERRSLPYLGTEEARADWGSGGHCLAWLGKGERRRGIVAWLKGEEDDGREKCLCLGGRKGSGSAWDERQGATVCQGSLGREHKSEIEITDCPGSPLGCALHSLAA